jgi:hypothetical protein
VAVVPGLALLVVLAVAATLLLLLWAESVSVVRGVR